MIALSETRVVIGENRDVLLLPLHSMLFFRCDMLHAGAAYRYTTTQEYKRFELSLFGNTFFLTSVCSDKQGPNGHKQQ